MGELWADVSEAPGGWSGWRSRITVDGPRKPNTQVIKAVIDFAKSTERFYPKAFVQQEEDGQRHSRTVDGNHS